MLTFCCLYRNNQQTAVSHESHASKPFSHWAIKYFFTRFVFCNTYICLLLRVSCQRIYFFS
ncbi:hypothetical protein FOXYSP1_03297 [Fusarium oxysporum f. sp. phaseoli]